MAVGAGLSRSNRFDARVVDRITTALVDLVHSTDADPGHAWNSREVNGALIDVVDPVTADDVTRIVLEAYPRPPASPASALAALLSALPAEPRVWTVEPRTSRPVFDVPPLDDVSALAAWLDMSIGELDWFAARGRWMVRAPERLRHYRVKRIPKRGGGLRVIEAPKERLATAQRKILHHVLAAVPPHPAAHGFVRGRSVQSFAAPHSCHDVVVRLDLRHAFEHATYPRVQAVFAVIGYTPEVSAYLASLCTTVLAVADRRQTDHYHAALLRERHLPQGAPTSPALLNLVLRRLDIRVSGYAATHGITYTRYADDLAFSGDDVEVGRLIWFAIRVVDDEGFALRPEKTRVMGDHQRQRLGGLVVNRGPQARRSDYDALKALLHNASRHGAQSQNRQSLADFRAHVYGRIEWVATGSLRRREKLLEMAGRVDW